MALLREFYVPFSGAPPGMVGLEDFESLFSDLKNRKLVNGKFSVRHILSVQQFIEEGKLDNEFGLPGVENPVGGLTKLKSEMGPIPPLPETGRFQPGLSRPLKELVSSERHL